MALYGANRLDCNSPITAIKVNQESAVYPYNCILFSHRKNEILMYATAWVDPESMLGDTYFMIPLIRNAHNRKFYMAQHC